MTRHVTTKISFEFKPPPTLVTLIRFPPCVLVMVNFHARVGGESLGANVTLKRVVFTMSGYMHFQFIGVRKRLGTPTTLEASCPRVKLGMKLKKIFASKFGTTKVACEWFGVKM